MRARVAGSAIGLAVLVAGCGSSQPAAAPPTVSADVANVAFPSAREDREARTLVAARARLVRRCMAERGFTLPRAAPAPSVPTADALPAATGYGFAARFTTTAPAAPRQTATVERALMGSPRETATLRLPEMTVRYRSGGCYAKAMGELYGSARRYQLLVAKRNVVRAAAGARVAADPRFARALTGWSRCMAGHGLPYASPDEARQAVFDAYLKTADRARQRERATATADRACGERTALYSTLARAQQDALRAMSPAERAAAAALARPRAVAVERARR